MKELSIEEKARRYDKAIEIAKDINNEQQAQPFNIMTRVFPELAESEDERIRKNIIKVFKIFADKQALVGHCLDDIDWDACIAWLEKQADENTVDVEEPDFFDDFRKTDSEIELKFKVGQTIKKEGFNLGFSIVKIEDGFYYNDMGDYFPFTDQDNWELVEQKPDDWDEDKKELKKISNALEECEIEQIEHGKYYYCIKDYYSGGCKRVSKGEVVQALRGMGMMALGVKANEYFIPVKCIIDNKPTWSEEDDKKAERIIRLLQEAYDINCIKGSIEWLKSLKERYTWKPSDKQMDALRYVTNFDYGGHKTTLVSLYEQLKNLKG